MNVAELYDQVMSKVAAPGNPAAPVKSSLGTGSIDMGLNAPYLQGGGKAGAQGPSPTVESPGANYLNTPGGKSAGPQQAGGVGVHASPDSGERGMVPSADLSVTKTAAFTAGMVEALFAARGE